MQIAFERVIDLSYVVDENSPRELPIDPVRIYDTATMEEDGYFESRADLSGHTATHMDTPSLMYAEGFTIERVPVEKMTGRVTCVHLGLEPGAEITKQHLLDWEAENGQIPPAQIVFLSTGMQEYAYQEVFNRKWIGLTGEAAELLVSRQVKTIGTDGCSIDCMAGHDIDFPAHHAFLGNGIPIVENIARLTELPSQFFVTISPMKLARSSGAPARVFAFV